MSSSARRASGWLIAAAGLVVYVALVIVLPWDRVQPTSPLPWWGAQAVPPILYGVLTLLWTRQLSPMRWLVVTLSLWIVHITLGSATQFVADPSHLFPPPPVPAILWVPLLLFPLRDVLRTSKGLGARHRPADSRAISARGARAEIARPVKAMTPTSATSQSHAAPAQPAAALAQPATAPVRPVTAPVRPVTPESAGRVPKIARAETPASKPSPRRTPEAVRASIPPLRGESSARDTSGAMVRVSFNRIAEQLPVSSFTQPLHRIAAGLSEPGYLAVPERLVLGQLLEGVVVVQWDVVSEQFPRQLGLTDDEIAGRLSDGQLVLPLDEIVSQLPRELFVLTNPPLDLSGIESFPAPFQPLSIDQPEDGTGEQQMDPEGASAPVAETTPLEQAEPVPATASSPEHGPEIEADASARYEVTDVELELPVAQSAQPETTVAESVEPEPPAAFENEPSEFEQDEAAEADAEWSSLSPVTSAFDDSPIGPTAAPVPEATEAHGQPELDITSLLAPVGMLHVAVDSGDQESLVVVSALGMPPSPRLVTAARSMLPFLADDPAWGPLDLLTLRGGELALVLTRLDSNGRVLVAAAPPTRSLAMLEILCRRAALRHGGEARSVSEDDGSREEPDLVEVEPSTRIHALAQLLSAVGPVMASTLRDLESEWPVYCFLPPGSDVRATAALACEISRAMSAVGALSGMRLYTAVLTSGRRRLIIRAATSRSRGGVFVAAGEIDRPGLAYRQAAEAADMLLVA